MGSRVERQRLVVGELERRVGQLTVTSPFDGLMTWSAGSRLDGRVLVPGIAALWLLGLGAALGAGAAGGESASGDCDAECVNQRG
jgi:hypothetical protein